MSKNQKSPRNWNKYAFEMLSIIVGVLIALAVDEWNEDRQHRERAELALRQIHSEMKTNLVILDIIHPGNLAVREMIEFNSEPVDSTQQQIKPGVMLQEAVWETTLSSGVASYIRPDTLFYTLAQLYSLQGIYKDFGYQFIEQLHEIRGLSLVMENPMSLEEILRTNPGQLDLMLLAESQLRALLGAYLEGIDKE